jgi:hypothetical protein
VTELGLVSYATPLCCERWWLLRHLVSKSTVPPIGGGFCRTRLGRMTFAFTPYRRWVRLMLTAPSHPRGADALGGGLEGRRYPACGPRPLPGFHAARRDVP